MIRITEMLLYLFIAPQFQEINAADSICMNDDIYVSVRLIRVLSVMMILMYLQPFLLYNGFFKA